MSCWADRPIIFFTDFPGTSTPNDDTPKMLTQSLMETLKTMENKDSSSDEDSDEQNNIMFEKTASSAGCKYWLGSYRINK